MGDWSGIPRYADRREAGRRLSGSLTRYVGQDGVLVLALPRGGVPVAVEVAAALVAPLDVYLVRKLGVPGREELAMGAIASGGVRVLNSELVERLGLSPEAVEAVTAAQLEVLEDREKTYRGGRVPPDVRSRTVILVDDGLATGATMRAALAALRVQAPARLVVAVPVAPAETCVELHAHADEVVCAHTPEPFHAVGLWYRDFSETSDEEVSRLLAEADRVQARSP